MDWQKVASLLNNSHITKSSLLSIHQQHLDNGHRNANHLSQLVNVLGGIDQILHEYLSNDTIHLTDEQLTNIHQIITMNQPQSTPTCTVTIPVCTTPVPQVPQRYELGQFPKSQTKLNNLSSNSETKDDLAIEDIVSDHHTEFYYSFDKNETYLHQYFGNEMADKLLIIVHNKLMHIAMGLTITIYMGLLLASFRTAYYAIYTIIFAIILWIPFLSLWLLSSNVKGIRILRQSFEFWFKIVYAFIFTASTNIVNFLFEHDQWEILELSMIATMLVGIVIVLAIAVVSSFDAVRVDKLWKIILSAICASIAILWTIYLQLWLYQSGGVDVEITESIGLPLTGIKISTSRVLGIFLAKQAWNTWRRSKVNRCVCIKYTPFIKWVNSKDVSDRIHNVSP